MREWGIDISLYQDWLTPEDIAEFVDHGMTFGIVRLGRPHQTDPLAEQHIRMLRSANVPVVMGYLWNDPTCTIEAHIQVVREATRGADLDGIAEDVEQWWGSWEKWRNWRQGLISKDKVPVVAPAVVDRSAREVWEYVSTLGMPAFMYHGLYFPENFAPGIVQWTLPLHHWIPFYHGSVYARNPFRLSWSAFEAKVAGLPSDPQLRLGSKGPTLPDWEIWQVSDKICLPGCGDRPIDINILSNTLTSMFENKAVKWETVTGAQKDSILMNLAISHDQI